MTTTASRVRRDGFTAAEVAAANGVTRNHIYSSIYAGELHAVRLGRAIRIPRAELERLGWAIPEPAQEVA